MSLRVIQSSDNALTNYIPFKLCHRTNDREHRLPHGRARIESLLMADKVDPKSPEFCKRAYQLLHAPRKSIETPNNDDIEKSAARVLHQCLQPGAVRPSSTHPIVVDFVNLPSPLRSHLQQGALLDLRVLLEAIAASAAKRGAHSDINRDLTLLFSHLWKVVLKTVEISIAFLSVMSSYSQALVVLSSNSAA
jgi:hypothetical protein